MDTPTLIYCADGNKRFAQIAIDAGYLYGAQLPNTIYHQPYFVDQDWKAPNRERYMAELKQYRPYMASVMDWEYEDQLSEVLSWAEEAAAFVETIMIIPKSQGGVSKLPRTVGGKPVRLGYSVPTKFGGTQLFLSEFTGWPVHLLGGSPGSQMRLAQYLDVRSVDGNMPAKMAIRFAKFWELGRRQANHWLTVTTNDGACWEIDGLYEAFRRSCINIMEAWKKL